MTDPIDELFSRQDDVLTRQQSLNFLNQDAVARRLGRDWSIALPGIYLRGLRPATEIERQRAGLLHGGPGSMLNDITALEPAAGSLIHVLVSDKVQRSSRDFVVIRRTIRLPEPVVIGGRPVVPVARAVCEYVQRHPDYWDGLAVAAAAVQLQRVTVAELEWEASLGPAKGRPRLERVIANLKAGVRSAPEGAFRDLYCRCWSLPEALWNPLIELPGGQRLSPDCLVVDAGAVHEVNGRRYHSAEDAGLDAFVDMQRRADVMVAADLRVLSNAPSRIFRNGRDVIAEFAACCRRERGRGLPPGVRVLRPGPPGTPWLPGAR
jgi:hypothetical protein